MVSFFVIPYLKPSKQEEQPLLPEDELPEPTTRGKYTLTQIATNESNGDLLYVVEGDVDTFLLDYPATDYYEADWFQNYYPDAPGVNPIEKYYNATTTTMTVSNPPIWSKLRHDIATNRKLFSRLLDTTDHNAFSALQTAIQYKNMDLFRALSLKVITAIPGGLSEEEFNTLNEILESNNFLGLSEMLTNEFSL
ncbi:MAG: hypothetical protein ACKPCP_32935 [Sphaerospermopsis kisseleviana]